MEEGAEQTQWHCRLDTSGRVVIPQAIRVQKGLSNGDELVIGLEHGDIVLRTYEEAMQQLQDQFCADLDPEQSLVDELIADRREEAELEARS